MYLCSENKGADQLCSRREADLRLCLHMLKSVFLTTRSYHFYTKQPDTSNVSWQFKFLKNRYRAFLIINERGGPLGRVGKVNEFQRSSHRCVWCRFEPRTGHM